MQSRATSFLVIVFMFVPYWALAQQGVHLETCSQIEEHFRQHVLGKIEVAAKDFSLVAACLNPHAIGCGHGRGVAALNVAGLQTVSEVTRCANIVEENLKALKNYQRLYRKLSGEIAHDWMNERNEMNGGLSHSCFRNAKNQVELGLHARNLKVQGGNELSCTGEMNQWTEIRDKAIQDRLSGAIPSKSLTQDELNTLNSIQGMPWFSKISDNALFLAGVSDVQLKLDLQAAYSKIAESTGELHKSIQDLRSADLYKLYDFGSTWDNYRGTLPIDVRSRAETCKAQSSFFQSCLGRSGDLRRCRSKIWKLTRESVPVLSVIDGYRAYERAGTAQRAGVMTKKEATAAQAQAASAMAVSVLGTATGVASVRVPIRPRVIPNMKTVPEGYKIAILERNSALTLPQRYREMEWIVGRPLTPGQKEAVEKAHAISEKKGYFNLSQKDLRAQQEILRKEFTAPEADAAQRMGITGSFEVQFSRGATITPSNYQEVLPNAWKVASEEFGVNEFQPDTANAIKYLQQIYTDAAKVIPNSRPVDQLQAQVLSSPKDAERFLMSVKDPAEAREIIGQLQSVLRGNLNYRNIDPASGGNEQHWHALQLWRQTTIEAALATLKKTHDIP